MKTALLSLVLAAGHGGEHGDPVINWWELGGQTVTFLVFVVGLIVLTKKPIAALFLKRHEDIKTAVEEAKRAKAAAEAKFAEYQKKMGELDAELARVKGTVAQTAEGERIRLLAEAEATAKRIERDTEALIVSEMRRVEDSLRAQAAELAVALASDILKKEMKPEDHTRLVNDYLQSLAQGQDKQKAA